MNILSLSSVIFLFQSTLAQYIVWDGSLGDYNLVDWVVSPTDGWSDAIGYNASELVNCPPTGTGCFKLIPDVNASYNISTVGYQNFVLNYTMGSTNGSVGDTCALYAAENNGPWSLIESYVDGFPIGDIFGGMALTMFPNATSSIVITLSATSITSFAPLLCYFSDIILMGNFATAAPTIEPSVPSSPPTIAPSLPSADPTTAPTTATAAPTIAPITPGQFWSESLNTPPSPDWIDTYQGYAGALVPLSSSAQCRTPSDYCWELTPHYDAQINVNITGYIDIWLYYSMSKVGTDLGKCQILVDGFEYEFIENVEEDRWDWSTPIGSGPASVDITLVAYSTFTANFTCQFADLYMTDGTVTTAHPTVSPTIEPTPMPTPMPITSAIPTLAPITTTTGDCAWIDPVDSQIGLLYPVPSGQCHIRWTNSMGPIAETYYCLFPWIISHKVWYSDTCSNPYDTPYINENFTSFDTDFNCDTSQSCNHVMFYKYDTCDVDYYGYSSANSSSESTEGSYVTDICMDTVTTKGVYTMLLCPGSGFEVEPYAFIDDICELPLGSDLFDGCIYDGSWYDSYSCGTAYTPSINICNYQLISDITGVLPAAYGCIPHADGTSEYTYCYNTTHMVQDIYNTGYCVDLLYTITIAATDGAGYCGGYDADTQDCYGDSLYFESYEGCSLNGTYLTNTTQYGWTILDDCLPTYNGGMKVFCETDSTLQIEYYLDTECADYLYNQYVSTGCYGWYAYEFDCSSYIDNGDSDTNTIDWFQLIDPLYCPWVNDGSTKTLPGILSITIPEIVSPRLCNVYNGNSSWNWECVDHRMIRYTNYTDTACTLVDYTADYGEWGYCAGCGTSLYYMNDMYEPDELITFDCSYYDVYNESNCNYVKYSSSENGCDVDGSSLSTVGLNLLHIPTDVCFSDGDGSEIVICDGAETMAILVFDDGYCELYNGAESMAIAQESACFFGLDFECVSSNNIPVIEGPGSDTVYCPWINDPRVGDIMEPANVCTNGPNASYIWQCMDYAVIQYTQYDSTSCTGYITESFEIGTYTDHCEACGTVTRSYNDTQYIFDCSYYTQYDESNCNRLYFAETSGCDQEAPVIAAELNVVTDACFRKDNDSSSMITCLDDGALQLSFFEDDSCGTYGGAFTSTEDCNSTSSVGHIVECIYGDIPGDSDSDSGSSYDNTYTTDDVLCPWYATTEDNTGKAVGFCQTYIADGVYIAEYHECIDANTLRRSVWANDKLSVSCTGTPYMIEDITDTDTGARRRRMQEDATTSVGSYDLDQNYTFDCSNYAIYDSDNPLCNLLYMSISDSGCDISGELYDNKSTSVYISDVCWVSGDMAIQTTPNDACDYLDIVVYNDAYCEDVQFAFAFTDSCDNADLDGSSKLMGIEMDCVVGASTDYNVVIEPGCPYYWGPYDIENGPDDINIEPLIHAINVCEQDGASNSSIVTCRGTDTLIHTAYATADCSGAYWEMEIGALQYRCDGIPDACDLFEYTAYDVCAESQNVVETGQFVLGACFANDFDSFTTSCDDEKLIAFFYDSMDCSGVPMANWTVYPGCDNGVGFADLDGVCAYSETTTTTTAAPVINDVNITFTWITPDDGSIIRDPFSSFTATIYVAIDDVDSVASVDASCSDCFIWQIMDKRVNIWEDITAGGSVQFINSFTEKIGSTTYIASSLKIKGIRDQKQNTCYDDTTAEGHIIQPGNSNGYSFRLKVQFPEVADSSVTVTDTSTSRSVTSNYLPYGGTCTIVDIDTLSPLQPLFLECTDWIGNAASLRYNAIMDNVLMVTDFIEDLSAIATLTPIGTVSITVLIEDDLDAVSCYDIEATFAFSDTQTTDEITDNIDAILNSTDLGEDLTIVVAVQSVTIALYDSGELNQGEAQDIITDVTINVIATASIFQVANDTDDYVVVVASAVEITNVVATFVTLTANTATVDIVAGGGAEIVAIIPDVFAVMDAFVSTSVNDTVSGDNTALQDSIVAMIEETFELFFNLELTLAIASSSDGEEPTEEEVDTKNALAQELANFDTVAVTIALSVSLEEEQYSYIKETYDSFGKLKNKKQTGGKKVNPGNYANKGIMDQPSVSIGNQGMILPSGFSSSIGGTVDMTMSTSLVSYFYSKSAVSSISMSGTVTINIYISGNNRRRRRLASSDSIVSYNASDCFPFFIAIDVENDTVLESSVADEWSDGVVGVFPSCRYWNGTVAEWNPDGCFVFNISNTTVVCACTHLTTFELSAEDFIPRANVPSLEDFRDMTAANLIQYPTVWLVFVVFVAMFIIIAYLNPNRGNEGRSIVAYEDMIYHDVRKDKMESDLSGKQVSVFSLYTPNQDSIGRGLMEMSRGEGNKQKMCQLHWHLFIIQLRNDHTLLSAFQRTAGTNFSTRQRLGCFFMYLATIMVASAAFYGVSQKDRAFGDVTASFIMSLISTVPVLITKQLFLKGKPNVIKSTTEEDLDEDGVIDTVADDEELRDGPRQSTIRQQKIGQLKLTKTMLNTMDVVEKNKMDTTIKELNAALSSAQKNKSRAQRIVLCEHIRVVLFNKLYPLPRWCKKVAWAVLVIWSIFCAIIAIVYGLQFDIQYAERSNWLSQCWSNFEQLVIEKDLSDDELAELQDALNPHRSDNFPGSSTSSASWLLSLVSSTILSLIIWQPLTCYVTTAITLWMFTWNISMGLGPGSLIGLLKRACCKDNTDNELAMLNRQLSQDEKAPKDSGGGNNTIGSVVSHHDRPLDLIGFLGNDRLFVEKLSNDDDDDDNKEANEVELVTVEETQKEPLEEEGEGDKETDAMKPILSEAPAALKSQVSNFDIDAMADDYFGDQEADEIFGDEEAAADNDTTTTERIQRANTRPDNDGP